MILYHQSVGILTKLALVVKSLIVLAYLGTHFAPYRLGLVYVEERQNIQWERFFLEVKRNSYCEFQRSVCLTLYRTISLVRKKCHVCFDLLRQRSTPPFDSSRRYVPSFGTSMIKCKFFSFLRVTLHRWKQ